VAELVRPAAGGLPGERLDVYLVRNGYAASRREARGLIAAGQVRVNGYRCRKGSTVSPSDVIEVQPSPGAAALMPNSELAVEVLYHDAGLVVVNKPGLLPCHPLRQGDTLTLMSAVIARFPAATDAGNKPLEGGLVHRLDNGTSGATMVALTPRCFERLRAAIRANEIGRSYLALVEGAMPGPMDLDAPIAHHPRNRRKMVVVHDPRLGAKLGARPAATAVRPIEKKAGRFTLVEVSPRSGSRHQIRAHLADAGYPIAGDDLYGGPTMAALGAGRFFLHLAELRIPRGVNDPAAAHPAQEWLMIRAPLAADLAACLREIGA
jgi:23S rRNA pseudouridine1911/1915/1917 synthase